MGRGRYRMEMVEDGYRQSHTRSGLIEFIPLYRWGYRGPSHKYAQARRLRAIAKRRSKR
jgi:hypothetical protein